MPAHWSTSIASKIVLALKGAGPRFLRGMVGTWCAIGPIILLFGEGSANRLLTALLLLLVLLCYSIVFMTWFRSGWTNLQEFIAQTWRALCFIILGELGSEMTGAFTTFKGEMAVVYVFTGFFIAELMKPKAPIKALGKIFSTLLRNRLPYSR